MQSFISDEQIRWTRAEWDLAYNNSNAVPDSAAIVDRWAGEAATFRKSRRLLTVDLAYGTGVREKLDMFLPELSPPKGLMFFIHGGYWRRFDKSYFSQFAAGALARGYAVAMPSYDLKPHVNMSQIVSQIEQALMRAIEHVGGPVYVCGHSAGGHLAAMLIRENTDLSQMAKERIQRVIGISGLYELAPLTHTAMQQEFNFTKDEIAQNSPLRLKKCSHIDFVSWVGGAELAEFLRHSKEQALVWNSSYTEAANRHHFDVIDDLIDPKSELLDTLFAPAVQ